jgi:hypothetical protein
MANHRSGVPNAAENASDPALDTVFCDALAEFDRLEAEYGVPQAPVSTPVRPRPRWWRRNK